MATAQMTHSVDDRAWVHIHLAGQHVVIIRLNWAGIEKGLAAQYFDEKPGCGCEVGHRYANMFDATKAGHGV